MCTLARTNKQMKLAQTHEKLMTVHVVGQWIEHVHPLKTLNFLPRRHGVVANLLNWGAMSHPF